MVRKFKDDVILGWKVKYVDAGSGMIFAKVIGMPKRNEYMGAGMNKTQARNDVIKALTTYNKKHKKTTVQKKVEKIKANPVKNNKTESEIINSFKKAVKEGKMGTASDKLEEYKKTIRNTIKAGASDAKIKKMKLRLKDMGDFRIKYERKRRIKWFNQ